MKRAIKRLIKNKGGPLSPILSNIVLGELDKELEKRGLCFVRYADDCVIFVRSKRAGDRVMQSVSPAESGAEGKPGKERHRSPVGTQVPGILLDQLTPESQDPYPLENDQAV